MDTTLKTQGNSQNDGADKNSLDARRKGSFKEWITFPMRKLGQSRGSMKMPVNKNANYKENTEGTKSTIVAAATAATATITAIEHIQSKPSLLPQNPSHLPPPSLTSKDTSSLPPLQPTSTTTLPSSHHVEHSLNIVRDEKPSPRVAHTLDNLSTADHDVQGLSPCATDNSNNTTDNKRTTANNNTTANNDTTDNNDNDTMGKTDREKLKEDNVDDNNNKTSEDAKKYLEKRRYIIEELVETERQYVKDLGVVVKDYIGTLETHPLPSSLEGKHKIVFGNVQQIHEWHQTTFLKELEKCLDNHDGVGDAFNKYGRRLHMYVKYCENKPKSEYLVAEHIDFFEELRQKLGHRLQLSDLLIKPIQRIMKYQLLLKDIAKQTGRAGSDMTSLKKAVELMNVIPKEADDMMMVGRLQGFEGKITAQGKLLLQESLMLCEVKGERVVLKERRVFLFEQVIIFAEVIERKKALLSDTYIYKGSIMITKLSMEILPNVCDMLEDAAHSGNDSGICNCGNPQCACSLSSQSGCCSCLRFVLINKTQGGQVERLLCQAKDVTSYFKWVNNIQSLLDLQGDLLKALQSPIAYQKGLTTEKQNLLKHPSLKIKRPQISACKGTTSQNTPSSHKTSIMDGIKYTLLHLKSKSQEDLHKTVRS